MVSAWCLSVCYCKRHSGGDDAYIQLPASEFRPPSPDLTSDLTFSDYARSIQLIDSCITESSSESIEAVLHSVMKSHEFSPGITI